MGKGAVLVAALFFAFMAIVHLGRIFCPFHVQIGSLVIPDWISYVAFIFFGILTSFLFKEYRKNG